MARALSRSVALAPVLLSQAFSVEWDQQMEEDVLEVYRTFPDPWRVQVRGGG